MRNGGEGVNFYQHDVEQKIPVQLVRNSLYMTLNTKTGIVCQQVQKKWSLKDRA